MPYRLTHHFLSRDARPAATVAAARAMPRPGVRYAGEGRPGGDVASTSSTSTPPVAPLLQPRARSPKTRDGASPRDERC